MTKKISKIMNIKINKIVRITSSREGIIEKRNPKILCASFSNSACDHGGRGC